MRVHHLNCATMCPPGGPLAFGPKRQGVPRHLVCHCLLIETEAGLVLVDTGLGLEDLAQKHKRLGRLFDLSCRPLYDPDECAQSQIKALGFSPGDVQHIVLTHLDLDHAGGLGDFPDATVHVYAPEHSGAMGGRHPRWVPAHWAGVSRWELCQVSGEPWFGFECVRRLKGLPPEILVVPVIGHSPGHCAIAVESGERWLMHCGDAYFHRGTLVPEQGPVPSGIRLFENIAQHHRTTRLDNQARLRQLKIDHGDQIDIFCSHDAVEFGQLARV